MEHLFTNCHGEWNTFLEFLAMLPFLKIYFSKRKHEEHHKKDDSDYHSP